jgi:hypothetical protein
VKVLRTCRHTTFQTSEIRPAYYNRTLDMSAHCDCFLTCRSYAQRLIVLAGGVYNWGISVECIIGVSVWSVWLGYQSVFMQHTKIIQRLFTYGNCFYCMHSNMTLSAENLQCLCLTDFYKRQIIFLHATLLMYVAVLCVAVIGPEMVQILLCGSNLTLVYNSLYCLDLCPMMVKSWALRPL